MAESQDQRTEGGAQALALSLQGLHACLLYTSDAADE